MPNTPNTLQMMYIGSQIVGPSRPIGLGYARKTDLAPSDMSDDWSKALFTAILMANGQWNLDPTPDNLSTIVVAEGLMKTESTEPEAVAAFRDVVIQKANEYATMGANDTEAFARIETMLHIRHQELLLKQFGMSIAPSITNDPIGSPVEKGEALLSEIQKITSNWMPESSIHTLESQIQKSYEYIQERREMISTRARLMNLPPELGRLCELVPYIRKGLVYTVKGPTKGGKSSLMGQMSEHLAKGAKVAYFAFEDSLPRKIFQQTCRLVPGASFEGLERGDYEGYIDRSFEVRQGWEEEGGSWILVHCPGKTAAWVVSVINRIQAQYGLDAVFCDYLQKFSTGDGDRFRGLSQSVELLKQRAEEPGKEIAMFIGSQVTVDAKGETHSRECYDLEMKSQCVFGIKRVKAQADEVFNGITLAYKDEISVWAEIWVEFNNDGGTGKETLINWKPRFMFTHPQFLNAAPDRNFIPVLTRPSQRELDAQLRVQNAYKSINAQDVQPF